MVRSPDIFRLAALEAEVLGHHWLGAEHLLLAVAALDDGGPTRPRTLAAAGTTHGAAVAVLCERIARDGPPHPRKFPAVLPIWSFAAAEAAVRTIAFGHDHGEPSCEDGLLGVLSVKDCAVVDRVLEGMGTGRDTLLHRLSAAGVNDPIRDHVVRDNPLFGPAERQAIRLGRDSVGTPHVMLALLAGEPDAAAREALALAGIGHEAYLAWHEETIRRSYPPGPPPRAGITRTETGRPVRRLLERAHALASVRGDGPVRSSHGLLAWLWEPDGRAILELEKLSATPDAVLTALTRVGVALPSVPLPEPDREPWGERVTVPPARLKDIVDELIRQLPGGGWGTNCHEGEAWIQAKARIDVRPIVARVLGQEG